MNYVYVSLVWVVPISLALATKLFMDWKKEHDLSGEVESLISTTSAMRLRQEALERDLVQCMKQLKTAPAKVVKF